MVIVFSAAFSLTKFVKMSLNRCFLLSVALTAPLLLPFWYKPLQNHSIINIIAIKLFWHLAFTAEGK